MKISGIVVLILSLAAFAFGAEDATTVVHGTVTKIDKGAKTVTVRSADGTEHVLHWTKDTSVNGAHAVDTGGQDSWHGMKEGSEVVARSTKQGTEDVATEVDKVGKGGLTKTEGTVKEIDRGGKKMVIKTADGTEHTFTLSGHAAADAGTGMKAGTEKGAKVAVYSTDVAGKKVAHFFEKL